LSLLHAREAYTDSPEQQYDYPLDRNLRSQIC
jgi:hypothetical protein